MMTATVITFADEPSFGERHRGREDNNAAFKLS